MYSLLSLFFTHFLRPGSLFTNVQLPGPDQRNPNGPPLHPDPAAQQLTHVHSTILKARLRDPLLKMALVKVFPPLHPDRFLTTIDLLHLLPFYLFQYSYYSIRRIIKQHDLHQRLL